MIRQQWRHPTWKRPAATPGINAILHTKSGVDGGTVTIVVIGLSRGVLVEIIDDGSAGTPVVKGDLYAAEGHGLFLVQHLAAEWGYLRDRAGTTVWFHLPATFDPQQSADPPGAPPAVRDLGIPAQPDDAPALQPAAPPVTQASLVPRPASLEPAGTR
jgi:hypothetical protein